MPESAIANFRNITQADRYFLSIAMANRQASDDPKSFVSPRSSVGAVIVKDNRILANAANILPPRLKEHHILEDKGIAEEERYHFIEHAERAAIYTALLEQKSLKEATIYCTRYPCSDCARAIIWAGIKRSVFASGYAGEGRWIESQRAARDMLSNAGVTVRVLRHDD